MCMFVASLASAGAPPVHVTSDQLKILSKEKRAIYSGHAIAKREATTITCDTLEVQLGPSDEVETILAQGHVVGVEGDREVRGDKATFNNLTGVLALTGNPMGKQGLREVSGEEVIFVSGKDLMSVKKPHAVAEDPAKKSSPLVIDADTLDLDSNRHLALWKGHVVATRNTLTVKAPELEALYNDEGTVTRIVAKHQVEAADGDRWATGNRANFDLQDQRLILTGNAQARQGLNRMKGSRVTFFVSSNKLEVENAVTVFSTSTPRPKSSVPKGAR
jgi:lipopolysaccharide export system protein LptA